jgi:hypothetical protein
MASTPSTLSAFPLIICVKFDRACSLYSSALITSFPCSVFCPLHKEEENERKRERTEIAILGFPDSSTKHFKNPNSTPTVLASLPN